METPVPPISPLSAFATEVVRTLAAKGFRAVWAGGCVRDMLLQRTPKDYDVATAARPEEIQAIFPRNVPVGAAFGVVKVLGPGENPLQIEVATFRQETTYSDGRRPDEVFFTDEVEDVKRRDFTVNGLLYDPLKHEILDHVAGRKDLDAKVIRAIGDPKRRFAEDHLRLMRAVRFAAQLGFEIEGHTFGALKANAANIKDISAERIRDELSFMLTGPNPHRAFELLKKSGLLKHILPEIDTMAGVQQPAQFHPEGDVWVHTLLLLEQLENAPLTLALGALLHDVGKPPTFTDADRIRFNEHERVGAEMTREILTRLRFPNDVIEQAVELVRQHMMFKDVQNMRSATLRRFLGQPAFDEHLTLHKLDCLAAHGSLESYDFCQEALKKESEQTLHPPPLLTGKDLIALGLTPGPQFSVILRAVEDKQLEGTLKDKAEAERFVREMMQTKRG